MRRFTLALAPLALILAALPSTAAAHAVAFRGTVVARSARPAGYLVAPRHGRARLVRTRAHLRLGRTVAVRGRLLADRSVRATRVRRATGASAPLPVGAAVAVDITGTVVSAGGGKLLLSINGVVLVIQVPTSVDVASLAHGASITAHVAIGTDPAGVTTLTLLSFAPGGTGTGGPPPPRHHPHKPKHHKPKPHEPKRHKPKHHKPKHHKPKHHTAKHHKPHKHDHGHDDHHGDEGGRD